MSVHIGELHTEVVPGGPSGTGTSGGASADDLEERLSELASRAEERSRRVAAEGFDD